MPHFGWPGSGHIINFRAVATGLIYLVPPAVGQGVIISRHRKFVVSAHMFKQQRELAPASRRRLARGRVPVRRAWGGFPVAQHNVSPRAQTRWNPGPGARDAKHTARGVLPLPSPRRGRGATPQHGGGRLSCLAGWLTHHLVYNPYHQAAAGAHGDVVGLVLQVGQGDLEAVAAGARVVVGLQGLVVRHVLDLHLVVDGYLLVV